jgi:hypothetical protein
VAGLHEPRRLGRIREQDVGAAGPRELERARRQHGIDADTETAAALEGRQHLPQESRCLKRRRGGEPQRGCLRLRARRETGDEGGDGETREPHRILRERRARGYLRHTPPMAPLSAAQPLHTRTLSIDVRADANDTLSVEGTILDLRKCGALPTGGELQTAGFIHHMIWRTRVEEPSGRIAALEIAQPAVAMERGPGTGGECCRDPAPRLQALVGSAFDAGFAKRLTGLFGGPLGCSHLVTLGQAIGALLPRVLARARGGAHFGAGERVAKSVLFLDGAELPGDRIEVTIQAAEYQLFPAAHAVEPIERIASCREVALHAETALADSRLLALAGATRERSAERLDTDWESLADAVSPLVGGSALRGMAPRIFAQMAALPEGPRRALATEALLQLAPGLIQCMAALSHRIAPLLRSGARAAPAASPAARALMSSGGFADSCYMWRTGGALERLRQESG